MIERMSTISELPVTEIVVPADRLRPISEAKVSALMQLISEGVFLGAITVRRVKQVMRLVDGAHRLEAMRRLGRENIASDVLTCTDSEARSLEVSGNLVAGMTPVQDAIFLGVWQQEYERQHPETRGGVAGALARHGLQTSNMTFAEVVAETRQIKPRQVQKIIAAGRALSREERTALQSVSHRIAISEIEKLGKIGDLPVRTAVVEALVNGKKAAAAIRAAHAEEKGEEPTVKDPVEEAFNTLSKAWSRAPIASRKRFLFEFAKEIWHDQNAGVPLNNWRDAAE